MVAVHTEQAFEDAIEAHLLAHGYVKGNKGDFDLNLALDRAQLPAFVKDWQPKEWVRLSTTHGPDVEAKFLARVAKELAPSTCCATASPTTA